MRNIFDDKMVNMEKRCLKAVDLVDT